MKIKISTKVVRKIFVAVLGLTAVICNAQLDISANYDGHYTALFEEGGPTGPTTDKVIQLVENNNMQMLAVAACDKCFPALYTYRPDLSEKFGKAVFQNSLGLYVLAYESSGFIVAMPSLNMDEEFSYVNLYDKNMIKVKTMTKEKIEAYVLPLLDLL